VPESALEPGHLDTPLPAEVVFAGVARAFGAEPVYAGGGCQSTYCHGDAFIGGRPSGGSETSVQWLRQSPQPLGCGSCHGLPPPPPHPAASGQGGEPLTGAALVATCGECHQNLAPDARFAFPELHVDGNVTFFLAE
jgi:predicted CxxxxCH...CXXCH cytochrome family protein